jgi:hypothetical protein
VFKFVAAGAFAAFVVSGPLQHVGALPQTVVGDLSKQTIKAVLGLTAKEAFASCNGGRGFGGKQGNNGFGNGGFDGVPGKSADNNAPNAGQKREDRVR